MSERFDKLVQLMARLRAPDGCPWDRRQSHDSLKPYLLEETYEVLETIDHRDFSKLAEELGDLLLQVLFHAQIGAETGTFTIQDVMDVLAAKLVRRHPHVFEKQAGENTSLTPGEVYQNWEQIKREERNRDGREGSALDGVPKSLPALLRAYQVQARASRVGFDWPHTTKGLDNVFDKITEEVQELHEALSTSMDATPAAADARPSEAHRREVESELADLLFSLVNLARFLKINPEDALRQGTNRFTDRFRFIETEARRAGRNIEDLSLEEMDALWEAAKKNLSPDPAAPGSTT